jgi:beta-lactam-binding protein with PASTA domain
MGGITEDVNARITVGGDVLGQIAVGNNIVQIREHHGNLVFQVQPDTNLIPKRRPLPPRAVRRSSKKLFGRQAEVALLVAEASAGRAVAVDGKPGIGRSALLREVAAHESLQSVKYLSSGDLTLDDATQVLFDAFFYCDIPLHATPEQAKAWLQEVQASIIIDDVEAANVRELVDLAPSCGFVLAATSSPVDGVRSVQLNGLGPDDARALFESGLGRTLGPDEIGHADKLCILAENSPSRVLQMAVMARSSNQPLNAFADTAWSSGVLPGAPPTGDDLRLIDLLAAIPDIVMPESWLAELIDLPDTVARLDQLVSGGLVKAVPDVGYRLVELRTPTDEARTAVVEHAVRFAQTHRAQMHNPGPMTEALKRVQADCTQRGNWQAVLDIGAVLDPVYAQSGRWDAWKDVLAPMLTAARALGDRAAEARALHQLGTRELCLLGAGTAAGLLAVALRIRQMIGDSAGAAATQHNISLIPAITAPVTDHGQPTPRRGPRPKVAAAVAGTALMIVATTTVAITLTSYAPAVSFDPTGLTFPVQPVSTPGSGFMVDLVNAGQATAHITAPRTVGTNATDFDVTATTCGVALPVGQHCSTTVAFTPLAEGKRTALLEVDVTEGGSVAQVSLAGTGSQPTGVVLDPTSLDFGKRIVGTTSATKTLTLTAPATGAHPLGQLTVEGPGRADYTLLNNTCLSQGLPSGGSCVVDVQFTPQTALPRDARIQIIAVDGSIMAAAPLRGVGTPPPTSTGPAPGPTRVTVPDLVGNNVGSVGQVLAAAGLVVGNVEREPNESAAADTVLRSQPGAGTKVDEGTQVDIVASSGPTTGRTLVTIPDLVGNNVGSVGQVLAAAGLVVGNVEREPNESAAADTVLRSQPGAGTKVEEGTQVDIMASSGGTSCVVPDVVNKPAKNALAMIKRVCASTGSTKEALSDAVPKGAVISTNPSSGATITKGAAIQLVVSKGGVRVPNVVGKYKNDAEQTLTNAGLKTAPVDHKDYENLVSSTRPAAGMLVEPDSTVGLVFESAEPIPSPITTSPEQPINGG